MFYVLTGDRLVEVALADPRRRDELLSLIATSGDPLGTLDDDASVSVRSIVPVGQIVEMTWRSDRLESFSLTFHPVDRESRSPVTIEAAEPVAAELRQKIAALRGTTPEAAAGDKVGKFELLRVGVVQLVMTAAATASLVFVSESDLADGITERGGRNARRAHALRRLAEWLGPGVLIAFGTLAVLVIVWRLLGRLQAPPVRHALRFSRQRLERKRFDKRRPQRSSGR